MPPKDSVSWPLPTDAGHNLLLSDALAVPLTRLRSKTTITFDSLSAPPEAFAEQEQSQQPFGDLQQHNFGEEEEEEDYDYGPEEL